MSLYKVRDLKIEFPTHMGTVHAVRGISFDIGENECVALDTVDFKAMTLLPELAFFPKTVRREKLDR